MATVTALKNRQQKQQALGRQRAEVSQMQSFLWTGIDKRGVKLSGEQISKNASLVKADLRRQGINPQVVKAKPKNLFGQAGSRIKPRDIAVFARQLATMMAAGVPMVQGFEIVAGGQSNPRMKKMLTDIKTDIEGGTALNEALAKHPVQFDELFCNLVQAGESAGVLDTVLDTVATYKENIEAIKGKIKKAMFYPATVLIVAFAVAAILLIFVVPQFEAVFKNFGSDLPAFTQLLVNASRFMVSYWWLVLFVVIGTVVAIVMLYKRSERFAHLVGRSLLKLPVVGQILRQSAIARFSRTLGVTFRAGVPLVEALDSVSNATGSVVYNDGVKRIREDVAVVNNAVDALSSLLEPFIMIIIGVIVGGMVVGMYLPIFKLAAVVG